MTALEERIEGEIAALGDLPREDLTARWTKVYGCTPPKGVKRGLLERAAAWHLQARHLGGLSPIARKAIRDAVRLGNRVDRLPVKQGPSPNRMSDEQADDRQAKPKNMPAQSPGSGKRGHDPGSVHAPALRPGTRLVREWNGSPHVVDVSDDGFVFDGKTYRSLSAIARRITGAHWSGPRFFGL